MDFSGGSKNENIGDTFDVNLLEQEYLTNFVVKSLRGYCRGGCFRIFGIYSFLCHMVRDQEVFLIVVMGSPICHKFHATCKNCAGIFCGCTIYMMRYYKYFLFSYLKSLLQQKIFL